MTLDEAADRYRAAAVAAHNAAARSRLTRRDLDATPRQAVLEARMSAQENGWRVKRGHSGTDRCPACREGS